MSDVPEPFSSIAGFFFEAPLYAEYDLSAPKDAKFAVTIFLADELVVDGHCVQCGRLSTFHRKNSSLTLDEQDSLLHSHALFSFILRCQRNKTHEIVYPLRTRESVIQKVGQYPSLADIANDESRIYRKVLAQPDAAELHRAIGLAAHGVGVGSFVYLRRIFERLINKRFEAFKAAEGWQQEDFIGKRMDEKIELLEHHLPDFLVRNKKIYSILSKGIHELEEKSCLSAFEMLKQAIFFILDEDRRNTEELERRRAAEKAIAAFKG